MKTLLPAERILELLFRQLSNFFFLDDKEREVLAAELPAVLDRCEYCFMRVDNKYFRRDGEAWFNPYHSGQWLIFLCFMASAVSRRGSAADKSLADRVYYLNKIMNGVDIYHEVRLPDVLFFEHPLGSVIGRANIGDGLTMYQGCTIGGNPAKDGKIYYPEIGRNFTMYANSRILGNCRVGDNVTLASGAYVKDTDIPAGSVVFGVSPNISVKSKL